MTIDSFRGTYRFLSNFFEYPVEYKGKTFASVEHAYQAYKADNDIDFEIVAGQPTPGKAKRAGQNIQLRADWNEVRLGIMTDLIRAKFTHDRFMLDLLRATGNATLAEGNTWHDNWWGICTCPKCADEVANNHLGMILMMVRTELAGARLVED